jgi:ABC-type amino acid transport substrate-binding protein
VQNKAGRRRDRDLMFDGSSTRKNARATMAAIVPARSPHQGSVGPTMALDGLDIDVSARLARKLGVRLETVPVTSANRIPFC